MQGLGTNEFIPRNTGNCMVFCVPSFRREERAYTSFLSSKTFLMTLVNIVHLTFVL